MQRREFIAGMVGAAATAALPNVSGVSSEAHAAHKSAHDKSKTKRRDSPNIIFIMVDQMRFPMHFPVGINTADDWMRRFMPNVYNELWGPGVVFANHHTASSACSPSRAVWMTGLYAQQTWVTNTVGGHFQDAPPSEESGVRGKALMPPSLLSNFPTYGQLLRTAGYKTPYVGKVHVATTDPYINEQCDSNIPSAENYTAAYGFDQYICPDPAGSQGQGAGTEFSGVVGDPQIADAAIQYLANRHGRSEPFCLTVSFVNPHDQEYFWGGTEPDRYMTLSWNDSNPLGKYDKNILVQNNPPSAGFSPIPENWESFASLETDKPSTQAMMNEGLQAMYASISFESNSSEFTVVPSLIGHDVEKAVAPYRYWQRCQDSYVMMHKMVDEQIGRVLAAIPPDVRANSVIIFSSDHGDYNGSHGFSVGKIGSAYKEVLNVPLIVRDFTGRFAGDVSEQRQQLTSSVDILRLLVTLGYNGSTDWLSGDLETLYGKRFDLLSVIKSNAAPGRSAAFFTSDEYVSPGLNYNGAPLHILTMLTPQYKLNLYSHWKVASTELNPDKQELEFYDYSTPNGRLELENNPLSDIAQEMLSQLLNEYLPNEIRAAMPDALKTAHLLALQNYLSFANLSELLSVGDAKRNIGIFFGADLLPPPDLN